MTVIIRGIMNKASGVFLLIIALGFTACSKQAEPPSIKRFSNPKYQEDMTRRQQLCSQVTINPGRAIAAEMRVTLFNCLNYDGSLNDLAPLIMDNELFDSLNSVMSSGDSDTLRDVLGSIDEEKIIQLLPFMAEILKRNVIPNIVPVVSKVVGDLSENGVLRPMLPSITSMFQSAYFEFAARSSSSAISSGAMGILMKRLSSWLLSSDEGTLIYKKLLLELQSVFREREVLTPLLPFANDVLTSGAIGPLVQGPYPDPQNEPNRLKDLLTHPLDPIVKLTNLVHTLNRPNNRFLHSLKVSFLQYETLIKKAVVEELRRKFIERIHGMMIEDLTESDFRRFFTERGYSYDSGRMQVKDILNLFFCYFDAFATNQCPSGFRQYINDVGGLKFILSQFDRDLSQNENFINDLEEGLFLNLQDEYTDFVNKYTQHYSSYLDQEGGIREMVEDFIHNFALLALDENKTMNQILYGAWDDAIWRYYRVDLGFLELWNQIVDKIKSLEFDTDMNLAEEIIKEIGKNPPGASDDGDSILKTIFEEFELVKYLEEVSCREGTCKTLREWIISYYLPQVREVPSDPLSPPAWSNEDLDFTHDVLRTLPALEVLVTNGTSSNGKILHALHQYNSETYPLFKDLVSLIEFARNEEFIQKLRPLLISAIDSGLFEAFLLVEQRCQDSPFMCWSKKVFASQGLFDLVRPQQDDNLETSLINNIILLIRTLVDREALPLTGEFLRVTAEAVDSVPQEELDRFLLGLNDLLTAEMSMTNNHPLGKFTRELGEMIEREDFQRLIASLDRINRAGNLQPMLNYISNQIDNGNAEKILRFAFRLIHEME
ncbi:MAG: hypothetical protein A3F16_06400 [Deltaproteobacteria bacterium RIFCSPHIGHO2_12_FULL_43_9]|nr:MAG: hypothetical protein A3F16_06400 [Deltaproteobacteria bacterium RIFCSPHIGHO2_12_FULL_43_9]